MADCANDLNLATDAAYQVMVRRNQGLVIFRDDQDRRPFLDASCKACEKTGRRIPAWRRQVGRRQRKSGRKLGGEATTLGSGGGIWLKTNHVTIIGLINIKG